MCQQKAWTNFIKKCYNRTGSWRHHHDEISRQSNFSILVKVLGVDPTQAAILFWFQRNSTQILFLSSGRSLLILVRIGARVIEIWGKHFDSADCHVKWMMLHQRPEDQSRASIDATPPILNDRELDAKHYMISFPLAPVTSRINSLKYWVKTKRRYCSHHYAYSSSTSERITLQSPHVHRGDTQLSFGTSFDSLG